MKWDGCMHREVRLMSFECGGDIGEVARYNGVSELYGCRISRFINGEASCELELENV